MTHPTNLPDYSKLIDSQTQSFIQRTEAAFPENAAKLDIEQQRALYNTMCREFHASYPDGVSSLDAVVGMPGTWPVPIRQYTPSKIGRYKQAVQILYLHGGGFVVGGLDSHDDVCAEICDRAGTQLTSVDYRLSPEHKHPAALNDTMQVIEFIHETYRQPIVICGDSAGANLSAAACHAFRNLGKTSPEIIGQVLIYPGLGGDTQRGSYVKHAHSPMLGTEDVHFYSAVRCTSDTNTHDPLFAPLKDTDFSNLPPTVVFGAECDPLSDDGNHYCQYIRRTGGKAHWIEEPGLVHGYLRARHSVDRAAKSFNRINEAVVSLANRQWPF
ncbi:MAG: alpha/beta hydrolase [Granulosicoccus sp.]